MTEPLLPGAEPWSAAGGPAGALCLHGFTGNPSSMRGLAEAFAAAGFSVELPRLPGHGTTVEEMKGTGWADWTAEVEAAYQRLAARDRAGRRRRPLDGRQPQPVDRPPPSGGGRPGARQPGHHAAAGRGDGDGARDARRGRRPHARHRGRHRRSRRDRERLRGDAPAAARVARRGRAGADGRPLRRDHLPAAPAHQPAGPRRRAGQRGPTWPRPTAVRSSGSASSAATTSPRSTTTRTSSSTPRSPSAAR